jgi:ABC-type transport system substrate-binding protein
MYVLKEMNGPLSIYHRSPRFSPVSERQHPDIVEWRFPSASAAVDALIGGEIDVVDRVPLADLHRLREDSEIEVRSYIVPTVHMLIPNVRNKFTGNPGFRNGLFRGINRELILHNMICGGREIDGCELISGPFPVGTEENDQLAYGYNVNVPNPPFDEMLGMVLIQNEYIIRRKQLIAEAKNPTEEKPTFVLAHADDELAVIASTAIQQMWQQIGVRVELRRLETGQTIPPDDEWDFLYYQVAMQEPLTDSELLFGTQGIVKSVSAPILQNMKKLGYADSWQSAGTTLRRIHRQVANDLTIIPLWQLKEHYAFRQNVKGIGANAVHFYETVLDWNIQPSELTSH